MYYVKLIEGVAISASTECPTHAARLATPGSYETRNDWGSMERAERVAGELNKNAPAGSPTWIATDAGSGVSPRYDVIPAPAVGDLASYAFNGDCTPCGKIASVSKSLRVVKTDDGSTFYRKRLTGTWKMGGTWSLVSGHHDERNPSF